MPPKAQKEIVYPINSEEHFQSIANPENKKLSIIDLHATWCGPCQVMFQNYRTIYFNYEQADNRIEFWTCDTSFLPADLYKKYITNPTSCKPKFLIYLEGEIKGDVEGADISKIENLVTKYIPALDE